MRKYNPKNTFGMLVQILPKSVSYHKISVLIFLQQAIFQEKNDKDTSFLSIS